MSWGLLLRGNCSVKSLHMLEKYFPLSKKETFAVIFPLYIRVKSCCQPICMLCLSQAIQVKGRFYQSENMLQIP